VTNTTVSLEGVRETVLRSLERERSAQLLYVDTLRDAATLAGEQVQDVRLDLIDNPPKASTDGIFLDILVALALGPVATAGIRQFANVGTRAVLSLRSAASRKNGGYSIVPFTLDGLRSALQFVERTEALELARDKAMYERWAKITSDVLGTSKSVLEDRLKGGAGRVADPDVGADTASVAVRRAAYAFARMQERTVEAFFAAYLTQVRSERITIDELLALNKVLTKLAVRRAPVKPTSNEEFERELSTFFEACIWLLHFGEKGGIAREATEERSASTNYGPYGILTSRDRVRDLRPDRPIVRYWTARLTHPDGKGSFLAHESKGAKVTSIHRERAASALLIWFVELEDNMKTVQQNLEARGFIPTGPQLKFK
jgi:hypothetical protein